LVAQDEDDSEPGERLERYLYTTDLSLNAKEVEDICQVGESSTGTSRPWDWRTGQVQGTTPRLPHALRHTQIRGLVD